VQEEARKYEPEFPNELYREWHRLYDLAIPKRGKPWHFKALTVRHIYYPLAQSSGKLFELLKALKARDGDRAKKLFQFLNEIGARALKIQLGRVLEMAESSPDKFVYENKVAEIRRPKGTRASGADSVWHSIARNERGRQLRRPYLWGLTRALKARRRF
jgi:hypothetical protein